MSYNSKHTGAVIDQQIGRVIDGSAVVDNTLSALDENSNKPVSGKGIAKAIEAAILAADLVTPAEVKQAILDNTAKKIEKGEAKPVASDVVAEALETRDKQLDKKADKTEYYPEMAVGTADNLRGRGEAKEEFFTYRPSAGASNSISEEGVATMKRIKGNSLVWNNLSASIPEMAAHRSYLFDFDGVNTFTVKADKSSNNLAFDVTLGKLRPALNHYYLFIVEGSSINDITVYAGSKYPKLSDGWAIVQCTGANGYFYIYSFGLDKDIVAGTTFTIDSVKLVDLTQMFGAGNEPTTIEEFYARIPEGIDINTYNAGELMSMNINTIRTNGLNQWDEKWEVGGIYNGKGFPSSDAIRSANFMPALPDTDYYLQIGSRVDSIYWGQIIWYDKDFQFIKEAFSNGTTQKSPQNAAYFKIATNTGGGYLYGNTYNNDICINLSHSGVRDGEYEPYEERVHEIPEIAQYFPEGMRSAGGVYDEINESWAIQRVGVRAYEEGDDDDSEVMTDGINTVYPLAEPVVTPLPTRAINLNYPVWDWGTERAVSAKPSAPFRADIVYGFNAVDTIRINKSDIEALFKRVVALEAKVAESEAEATAEPTEV